MSKTEGLAWRRTSPLSAVFFVATLLRQIGQNAVQTAAPIGAFAVAAEGPVVRNVLLGTTALLVGVGIIAVFRYLFFRYRIEEDSVLIRDGVFQRKQLDIQFDRIQAVNTEQGVLYRPFGLVDIRFDTAGSTEQEGFLPAVPRALARELEERLHTDDAATRQADDEQMSLSSDDPESAPRERLLSYDFADLLRIGLTSNRALIFLAVLAPFMDNLFSDFAASTTGQESAEEVMRRGVAVVAGLIVLFMLGIAALLLIASIVGAVLRYYGFELTAGETRFRSSGGLLTRHEQSVRYAKVQALYLYQNAIQRLLGVYRLNLRQAASGKQSQERSFALPVLQADQAHEVIRRTLGAEYPDAEPLPDADGYVPVDRHYLRSQLLIRGVAPAIVAVAALASVAGWIALVPLLWIPLTALVVWRRYQVLGLRVSPDGLSFRSGLIGRRVVTHLHRRVQRITIVQAPWQARRGLANLRLQLAAGSVRIPYLRECDAERLRDYVLYRVETDARPWL